VPGVGDQGRDAYRRFGEYLRSQRQLAQLTLRQLAEMSSISNPYLSQIERGLHQPSVAVIRSIADALNLSADVLLAQVAGLDETDVDDGGPASTETAIRADSRLTSAQKSALLSVYRSMIGQPAGAAASPDAAVEAEAPPAPEPTSSPKPEANDESGAAPDPRRSRPRRPSPPRRATSSRAGRTSQPPAPPAADGPQADDEVG
jgi:transcriptional regulator with XRE-family HTH domain